MSPLASTDALLPSFQPDDDAAVKSPQPTVVAEHSPRSYANAVPPFAARRNRSPRTDELYSGPAHAGSYAGHSPRPEVTSSALHRSSYPEHNSPRSTAVVVEDLTSHSSKHSWAFDQQTVGDDGASRDTGRSNVDLLRVDTSPSTISRQSRDPAARRVSHYSVV